MVSSCPRTWTRAETYTTGSPGSPACRLQILDFFPLYSPRRPILYRKCRNTPIGSVSLENPASQRMLREGPLPHFPPQASSWEQPCWAGRSLTSMNPVAQGPYRPEVTRALGISQHWKAPRVSEISPGAWGERGGAEKRPGSVEWALESKKGFIPARPQTLSAPHPGFTSMACDSAVGVFR